MDSQNNTRKGVVLIVDDEQELVEIISDLADEADFEAIKSFNGMEALDVISSQHVDVIISDLKMPVMDGLQLLRLARERDFWNPFIFLTGYADKSSSIEALRLGAYDYQTKPFDQDKLQALMIDAMQYSLSFQILYEQLEKTIPDILRKTMKRQLLDAASKVMSLKALSQKASGE